MIIGCDYHPGFQQIAFVDTDTMREADIEVILQRAKEKYREAKPRIISDNGPQFIARDFKEFIRHLWHDARPRVRSLSHSGPRWNTTIAGQRRRHESRFFS